MASFPTVDFSVITDRLRILLQQLLQQASGVNPIYLYGNFDQLQAFKLCQLLSELLPQPAADFTSKKGLITLAPHVYLCASSHVGTMTTNEKMKSLDLQFDNSKTSVDSLAAAINRTGYKVVPKTVSNN